MNTALVEQLEELMDLRQVVRLRFVGDNGGIISLQARITNMELEGAEPLLVADGAIRIPLQRIVSVNDRPANGLV
jgi:hypothetical protein